MILRTTDRIGGKRPFVRSTKTGFEATRFFVVTEVGGPPEHRNKRALEAPGLPLFGEAHPLIPSIGVTDLTAIPIDTTSFDIVVSYTTPSREEGTPDEDTPPQIEVGTRLESGVTNYDKLGKEGGNRLLVTFTKKDAAGVAIEEQRTGDGTVQKFFPKMFLRLSRVEAQPPIDRSIKFVGKVNSDAFLGQEPQTWLIMGITGRSNDGGATYVVDYEFLHNPDTWRVEIGYTDPSSGQHPMTQEDIDAGNGLVSDIEIYEQVDFSELDLKRADETGG